MVKLWLSLNNGNFNLSIITYPNSIKHYKVNPRAQPPDKNHALYKFRLLVIQNTYQILVQTFNVLILNVDALTHIFQIS